MDPSIMKLLEEDEDESMHYGADVEAFTAALNRDIEGDTSTCQPSDSDSTLSQSNSHTSNQLLSQWQTSGHNENANFQSQRYSSALQLQEQHASEMEPQQHGPGSDNQQQIDSMQELNSLSSQQKQPQDDSWTPQAEQKAPIISQSFGMQSSEMNLVHVKQPDKMHNPENETQYLKLQNMNTQQAMPMGTSNQQPMATGVNNQQALANSQALNAMNRGKQVPFARLLPVIEPQLDKDRAMQLRTLYLKLKKNEISKEGFVRHMRSIVGDQMLKMAVYKLQSQAVRTSQNGPSQFPVQSQASAQQHMQMPSAGGKQLPDSHSFAQLHHKGPSFSVGPTYVSASAVPAATGSSNLTVDNNAQKSREVEHQSDSHGMQVNQMPSSSLGHEWERPTFPMQGLSKQQQHHLHFSQTSFGAFGSTTGNFRPYSSANVNITPTSLKHHPHESQMRQVSVHQSMGAAQLGTTQAMNMMSASKFERQDPFNEPKRVQGGSLGHMTNNSVHWQPSTSKEQRNGVLSSMAHVKQEPLDQPNDQHPKQLVTSQGLPSFSSEQLEKGSLPETLKDDSFDVQSSRMGFSTPTSMMPSNLVSSPMVSQTDPNSTVSSRMPSTTSQVGIGSNAKTPMKKTSVGQKKPLDAVGSSPPLSSKKQKVSGAFSDQSIEQLNDVTAVSGVNLREEEEQLFSGGKEDSRITEAYRRIVQEEEERLFLQRIPLQKKLAEIMAKCSVKSISNDVERCLSLCVEERMRGLISSIIRLSKQRVDIEKLRHRTIVTSDVRQKIMAMNQKVREEWEKKQAEAEKLQKQNDPENSTGVEGDKEKDEARAKSAKSNKEEDDKMRATAANVAARAAVGGDDMLSKWQLMAEQARQKREGGSDTTTSVSQPPQPAKDTTNRNPISTTPLRNARDDQDSEKRAPSSSAPTPGGIRKIGRSQVGVAQTNRVARSIMVKDVIAVLEREPQMSKSTLIYKLYERLPARTDAAATVGEE